MRLAIIEIALLAVLTIECGTIANLARSGDDEKFLPWTPNIYAVPSTPPKPTTPQKPEDPDTRAPTPETPSTPDGDGGTEPAEDHSSEESGEFEKIEFAAALAAWEDGEAQFVDARRTREYVEGHITGAVSMSPHEGARLSEKLTLLLETVPQEMPVIVYCTASANCEDSTLIAHQLKLVEYQDIRIYKGGFPEWESKLKGSRDSLITVGEEPGEAEQ